MKKEGEICSCCGKHKRIVNKFFFLCMFCNNLRLSKNKKEKTTLDNSYFVKDLKSVKKTTSQKIKEDEHFYEKCFNQSNHKCEECGCQLPDFFRDENGKVAARWRYSHIIPKSISKDLRHKIENINHLCLKHHMQWENGDKQNMNIYNKNKLIFPEFLK